MGTPCYIIGVTKQVRMQIGKSFGDIVEVVLQERDGGKPQTVDEYILGQDAEKQEDLQRIRQILRRALPEAEELQSYKTDKGTIRIPYGKVDAALIEKIAKWCWQTGNHA